MRRQSGHHLRKVVRAARPHGRMGRMTGQSMKAVLVGAAFLLSVPKSSAERTMEGCGEPDGPRVSHQAEDLNPRLQQIEVLGTKRRDT